MKKISLLILVLISTLLITGCFQRKAIGKDSEVLVLADENLYNRYKEQLEEIFNRPLYTPARENRYDLFRIEKKDFGMKKEFRNIILLFDVDSDSPESKYMSTFFKQDIIDGVRKGDYFYAFKKDQWAEGQNLIFLMDSKETGLLKILDEKIHQDKLYNFFFEAQLTRVKKGLFDKYNVKEAEQEVLQKYNYDMIVPHDFKIINEGTDGQNFIRFRRFLPDRWLTIIKGKYNENLTLEQNAILQRNETGQHFGDKVWINTNDKFSFKVIPDTTFSPGGIRINGVWEYAEGGGPFFTYVFTKGDDLYLIDGAVFAPGKDKLPYLDQLDVMARRVKILE